ncbi:hypothetical protein IVB34_34435 [Bradyrhizobium sp. 2]|uniref:hypothetical protein n=1 Tax=unclassified Bradyrhizobium TaxID=2631580 RepID=UPI001FFAE461|nr:MULTISPECIES: hypothetical protein [unclassified Bradyrhizobium]MCK1447751.1 hypothetical protein [Bradyrhizobium sp. 48]MCK1463320.1 hypothetical protein [Bradyrhizobium sp. 2]
MSPTKKVKAVRHAVKKAAKVQRRRTAVKKAKAPRGPDDDYSVAEWCQKRRISKPHFYEMMRLGIGPRTKKLKKRRTISPKADVEWEAERERETAEAMEAAA